jgi:uncharacterized membrane protein (UPF0127 family)
MRTAWLLLDGRVLAAADVADRPAERMRGLLGRPAYNGAMLLPRTRAVHTAFMRFPIDVAYVSSDLTVLATTTMGRWRVGLPRRGCHGVLEASAGSFDRWGLHVGDRLEIRDVG